MKIKLQYEVVRFVDAEDEDHAKELAESTFFNSASLPMTRDIEIVNSEVEFCRE